MSDRLAPPDAPQPSSGTPSGVPWRRSSRSTGMNNCVETARFGDALLAVRDSKAVGRGALRFSATAWAAFVTGLHGERTG
ncbi:DUF397 domain-containing protein [Streptomyces pratensis]|uniref:DUF397 domain-containing protein n=1 Tax=Streptomyces pratensis TaxID=1169025 RepID=UPI0030165646